jgi:PAS domain S-box-containing protein
LANAPDFVFFKDQERRFVRVSQPFESLLGRSESEILGNRDEDLFPPEVASRTGEDDRRVIEDGVPLVNRLEGSEDAAGNMVWVLTTKIPWRDTDGNILGLFGISRNITDRILAEDALRAETEFTSTVLDAQLDTVFVFEPGTGKAVRWNRAFSEVSGYTDEEIAELAAPDSYYSPEDVERAAAFISEVVTHGSGMIELQLICKDGSQIPTEYKVSTLNDEKGQPRYIISIGRDVTQRRQADQALRVQRERLARFMDSATDSFHLMDADLRVIEINETALARIRETGSQVQTKENVVGKSLLDVYPFLRGSGEEARFREVLSTGEPLTYDDSAEHPTRGTVHMTVKLFTVGDDLGLIATDISDRKRAEEERLNLERQFLHSQKLESLGFLTGGIAHDFNNILVPILGYADLALTEMAPGAPGRDRIAGILAGARQAKDLVAQMLAYSGQGRFELQPIDLNQLVREMGDLLRVSVSKKSALKYDFAESLPDIEGDKTQMRQIIMNLITNASEAIGDRDGVISIATGTTHQSDHVYLEVTDTGCGMDKATREKMFEPFFTTKFTGRGLGMSAVQGIVRGHRGAIEVHSQPNAGTRVRVLIPANLKQAVGTGDPKVRATEDEAWHGTGTVLVVDDEQQVRALAKTILELMGFEVLEAADGREAVRVFRKNLETIRAVILDLTMPHMDGEECFRALRELRSDIAVILSSGYSEHEITGRFAGLGIGGFIQKPYGIAAMRSKMREVIKD